VPAFPPRRPRETALGFFIFLFRLGQAHINPLVFNFPDDPATPCRGAADAHSPHILSVCELEPLTHMELSLAFNHYQGAWAGPYLCLIQRLTAPIRNWHDRHGYFGWDFHVVIND
jgi:hypothetical protein